MISGSMENIQICLPVIKGRRVMYYLKTSVNMVIILALTNQRIDFLKVA
jgi:hypothetical protein